MNARLLTTAELEAGLDAIRRSPEDDGAVEMIVRRLGVGIREILDKADLDVKRGLGGDCWFQRASKAGPVSEDDLACQITIMNARAISLIAGTRDRWPLAGDQLFLNLDLSLDNLAAGTLLSIGTAVVEISSEPHTGCGKFAERFGADATRFVNSAVGRRLRLRGLNARVIQSGMICAGDVASKLAGD